MSDYAPLSSQNHKPYISNTIINPSRPILLDDESEILKTFSYRFISKTAHGSCFLGRRWLRLVYSAWNVIMFSAIVQFTSDAPILLYTNRVPVKGIPQVVLTRFISISYFNN